MQQGPIQCAQQNNKIRHRPMGLKKSFRAKKKKKGLKPGMLSY